MRHDIGEPSREVSGQPGGQGPLTVVIATMLRQEGTTGVHTHFSQLRSYLVEHGVRTVMVTPFSWRRWLTVPVFGLRFPLGLVSRSAGVVWYRHWHAIFLHRALRRSLARAGDCVVYVQGPLAARAALRARAGPHQRVALAVHFRISQADEWADKGQIRRDGAVFRTIRQLERDVIPQVDAIVYVSAWARDALVNWLPEAAGVPYAIIDNFVAPLRPATSSELLADLVTVGHLEPVKNHRYLFQVLAEAKKAGQSVTLDIFGEGPLRKDLIRLARSLGLDRQVRFRGFRRDVRDFLPRYRAYAHTSYSESSSLAIIEAMAAGLPILAGDIGPISELCDDGVEARFWSLTDPAQAAATLSALLGSEPAMRAAGSAARERFRRDFDAGRIAPRLCSFLLGLQPRSAGDVPTASPR